MPSPPPQLPDAVQHHRQKNKNSSNDNQHPLGAPQIVCHFDNNTVLSFCGSYKRPKLPNEQKYAILVEIEDHTGKLLPADGASLRDSEDLHKLKLTLTNKDRKTSFEKNKQNSAPVGTPASSGMRPEQFSSQHIAIAALLDLGNREQTQSL